MNAQDKENFCRIIISNDKMTQTDQTTEQEKMISHLSANPVFEKSIEKEQFRRPDLYRWKSY